MYSEIRHSHMFGPGIEPVRTSAYDADLFAGVSIDGWKTDDDNEPGEVVAQVLMTRKGDIVTAWIDNGARLTRSVLEAIEAAKQDLRSLWNETREEGTIRLFHLEDDQGELDLIRVGNHDDGFERTLADAYMRWQDSQNEFHDELYGYLTAAGYDIEIIDCEHIHL